MSKITFRKTMVKGGNIDCDFFLRLLFYVWVCLIVVVLLITYLLKFKNKDQISTATTKPTRSKKKQIKVFVNTGMIRIFSHSRP